MFPAYRRVVKTAITLAVAVAGVAAFSTSASAADWNDFEGDGTLTSCSALKLCWYVHNDFTGLASGTPNGANASAIYWHDVYTPNDAISSLISNYSLPYCFYENKGYSGATYQLPPYSNINALSLVGFNDKISSIKAGGC
ncbi:peptidase inhibitor family I36 protein [Streptomyces sp. ok210]|jgi:hypothetical protein|uniref:peptidase inhibitor family I36 protein n=1 Tax=Streptomyces sp. ok210 TaxID=1761905 RepID=UPI0008E03403|nr:peptidase inhibitor family I36 protein [Streptomyces sp. ok210]SFT31411.1 Peptidase inhibitor family I36 [Streptomyces sp. ok210]